MNTWFKKFPYPGWLTLFFVALVSCVAAYQCELRQYSGEAFQASVQEDFNRKEALLLQNRRKTAATDAAEKAGAYSSFIITRDSITAWSTTAVNLPDSIVQDPQQYLDGELAQLSNGWYYVRSFALKPGQYEVALIAIAYEYPVENEYFRAHFAANARIPVSATTISARPRDKKDFAITDSDGNVICYLGFPAQPEVYYTPGLWVWLLGMATLVFLVFWIHECCYGIMLRSGKALPGWLTLTAFLLLTFLLRNAVGYPAGFMNARLFSPELFSSEGIQSLGDFLLTVLCVFWSLLFLVVYVPVGDMRLLANRRLDAALRLLIVAGLNLYSMHSLYTYTRKLIIDSKISFEAGNFFGLNVYTFLGIFCLAIITINFFLILAISNPLLTGFLPRRRWRYGVFLLICVGVMLCLKASFDDGFRIAVLLLSVGGLALVDVPGLPLLRPGRKRNYSFTAISAYLWFGILCSWLTFEIVYFNFSRERDLRKVFAMKQEQQGDSEIDYDFADIATRLETDTTLSRFLAAGPATQQSRVSQYIVYNYLSDYTGTFVPSVYYYDRAHRPLYANDRSDSLLITAADSVQGRPFALGLSNVVHPAHGNHVYWFLAAVKNGADTVGYLGIDLATDKRADLRKRYFLEQKNNPTDQQYFDNYSWAVYRNNTLLSQGGPEIFPYVDHARKSLAEYSFEGEGWLRSTLVFRASAQEKVIVVYKRNLVANILSVFSFVLAMLLALAAMIFGARQLLFYPGKIRHFFRSFNLTIRSKINLTVLITVFASLAVVGMITVFFLDNRYEETQQKNLRNLLLYYSQTVMRFSEEGQYDFNKLPTGASSAYSDLSYKLNALAEEQGAEANLYNEHGRLIATSQLQLSKRGLVPGLLRADILQALHGGGASELQTQDVAGELAYESAYAPLRDRNDRILAYINIPYYISGPERKLEISNVLVTLVNVYTLVFFLSGICAILISNSIVRAFRLLIDQFRNVRLRYNEPIEWPYRDEIGLLVKEYNAMIRKVETMATRLAHTEREEAWRDIAKQVAHEIKNPLTPMKLNIQYLQQAIASERPDRDALATRVMHTLIEQIENLNLIATAFSNFAKMPEARPEVLDLEHNLQSLVELFLKTPETRIILQPGHGHIALFIDKSYFLRVFTNLIQNALQAIDGMPEGQVLIAYEQNGDNVVIVVSDNGSGIQAHLQENLFLPYFTTKTSGTGLGLSMTKNMVEHSDGAIWFESEEGKGSSFYVQLPVHQNQNADDQ